MKIWESAVSQITLAVTKRPNFIIIFTLVVVSLMLWPATRLTIDASPDSLLLENDPDLKFYRTIHYIYGTDEYVIVAIRLNESVLAPSSLNRIEDLTEKFKAIKGISNVTSITNVPLIYQSLDRGKESDITFPTLLSKNIDIEKAKNEFLINPLYESNLISKDLKIAAFKIDFIAVPEYKELFDQRYVFIEKRESGTLTQLEKNKLKKINSDLEKLLNIESLRYKNALTEIRKILKQYNSSQQSFLSGAPLVSDDMKQYVQQDIKVFGVAAMLTMAVILFIIFHSFSWMVITLVCSFMNVLVVSGLIGLINFKLTIVSSNYIAILLIFSLAIGIHVVVRYQEEQIVQGDTAFNKNLYTSVEHISTPCLYMVLTSIIAFLSLIVSGIKPVIVFGYIMVIGLCSAYIISFTVLPALIKLLNPTTKPIHKHYSHSILKNFLLFVLNHKNAFTLILIIGLIVSIFGITKITVENRFIDYFKQNTDIHQGLITIDKNLGGTVPIEIILNVPDENNEDDIDRDNVEFDYELAEFDDYLAELEKSEGGLTTQSYWYNRRGMKKVKSVHSYLEGIPQIGKVFSLSSTEIIFQQILNEVDLNDFELSLIYSKLPENIKSILIQPYLSDSGNQTRIVARLKDSDRTLVRDKLISNINDDLKKHFKEKSNVEIKVTGIGVLYNNVLQSLYRSQILTLGFVFIGIFLMLSILLKSVIQALIVLLPNIFTALVILGFMGIINIPLNIMTITIAAIVIGIGVDDAIHYIHRYKKEYTNSKNVNASLIISQVTVGKALWFTSITIALGFVLLVFSNFTPSIYFGLFTCLAMLISIFATFTLIPLALSVLRVKNLTY